MRGWIFGTAGVVGGSIVAIVAKLLGMPRGASAILGMAISVAGFGLQMYSAFKMRADFERERIRREEGHRAFMAQLKGLSQEESAEFIIERIREMNPQ